MYEKNLILTHYPLRHNRKSIRLKEYDYSQPGEYFVTVCIDEKQCVFGKVMEEKIELSPIGEMAKKCWEEIPKHFPNVQIDEFIVMPNHVHGIILLNEIVGVEYIQPLQKTFQHVTPKIIGINCSFI